MPKVYELHPPEGPWGAYGSMLMSGICVGEKDGLPAIARTGPYVPPISLPSPMVVVTESLRARLESSGLTGFAFRPVVKKHIARLEWEKWDKDADDPPVWPQDEPEDYILLRPHSQSVAANMESLWDMVVEPSASTERVRVGPRSWDVSVHLILSSWNGHDFFKATAVGYHYVSERAKRWLEADAPDCVSFRKALTDLDMEGVVEWVPPPALDEELRDLVADGKLISAMLRYQAEKGGSLADAKVYAESLRPRETT